MTDQRGYIAELLAEAVEGNALASALSGDDKECVTIPAPVLKDVPDDFSPETRAAIASMKFVPAVKIAFQARRLFREEDHAVYGGISWTDRDVTRIRHPANGCHRDKGVIPGVCVRDDEPCMRFGDRSPPGRMQAAMTEGGRVHAGYSAEIESGVSRVWAKVPFRKGGWPEFDDEVPEALTRPDGAIHLCGDRITALPGWQEGAVLAAHAVVDAIGERVPKG